MSSKPSPSLYPFQGQPPPPKNWAERAAYRSRASTGLLFLAVLAWSACPRPALADPTRSSSRSAPAAVVSYHPPVDAPVLDPFRPPTTPYGPGNRGIEYTTRPGTVVRAASDGVVVFAGPVAGGLHVTLRYGDGIRTTYSYLAAIRVREGGTVRGGRPVGVAGAMLHFGARRGDTYIDPASLWGRPVGPPDVHLIPLDGYPGEHVTRAERVDERRRLLTTLDDEMTSLGLATVRGIAEGIGESKRP